MERSPFCAYGEKIMKITIEHNGQSLMIVAPRSGIRRRFRRELARAANAHPGTQPQGTVRARSGAYLLYGCADKGMVGGPAAIWEFARPVTGELSDGAGHGIRC